MLFELGRLVQNTKTDWLQDTELNFGSVWLKAACFHDTGSATKGRAQGNNRTAEVVERHQPPPPLPPRKLHMKEGPWDRGQKVAEVG